MNRHARVLALALTATLALILPAAGHAATAKKPQYYVNLGDSYAVGYQPGKGSTKNGFADQTVKKAKKKGYKLELVNFGCGGATTVSIIGAKGCRDEARALNGPEYKSTQADAAAKFIKKNRANVALITISISGNDVTKCARAGAGDPVACVAAAIEDIEDNLSKLNKQIRKAAGPKVRIVGTTYPDVILGEWVRPNGNQDLAKLSTTAFKALINPALQKQYEAVDGKFVDVTEATGAYTPLEELTNLPPYGDIPTAVAKVCELTYYCEKGDIHSKTAGYAVIADLIVGTLPKKK
ncbi:MAG: GDSL-type esterase/lipase family protein [Thermoleophilaceae bacterium]